MARITDYDFDLPAELVAQHPLENRSDARLMVIDRSSGGIEHRHVRDLAQFLRPEDCLVVNNSRVIPARLVGYRTRTHGRWEGLVLAVDPQGSWQVMSKTRGRIDAGETVTLEGRDGREGARLRMLAPLARFRPSSRPSISRSKRVGATTRLPLRGGLLTRSGFAVSISTWSVIFPLSRT